MCAAVLAAASAAAAQTPPSVRIAPVPIAPSAADRTRIALIERVGRSVVHVKGVRERVRPAPAPPTSSDRKRSDRRARESEELFRKMIGDIDKPLREEGSGFVVDSARGLVATAAHIVDRSDTVTVVLPDGRELPAERLGTDAARGVAVLRVSGLGLPQLSMTLRRPKAGESTLVLGWMIPLGSVMAIDGMVMGDVATVPKASIPADGGPDANEAQQLAGALALSNALPLGSFGGGPAVDADGRVVGLVTAIFGKGGFSGNSMTLAIPAAKVRDAVDQIAGSASTTSGTPPNP